MASIAPSPAAVSRTVIGGIDTHKDLHVGAVIDAAENVLGTASFPTTRAGYRALLRWMCSFGDVRRVGVERTGSDYARISRHLAQAGIEVPEVFRPDRTDRRRLRDHPDAATSLREGLADMFTVRRLDVDGRLARTLITSNAIESMISVARSVMGNVKR